jgi:hypothetical protein
MTRPRSRAGILLSQLSASIRQVVRHSAPPSPHPDEPGERYVNAVTHPLLERGLYRCYLPPYLADLSPGGALGTNAAWEQGREASWCLGEQRFGADLVQAGLVRRDAGLIESGWEALRWGLERQGPDGGFPGTAGRVLHTTAFFVEAVARALDLERRLGRGTAGERHRVCLAALHAAARWMARQQPGEEFEFNDRMTHRWWLLAAALGQAGAVTGDAALEEAAARFSRRGLQCLGADGVIAEDGGFDVRYQAMGLLYAARYALVCGDPARAAAIGTAVSAAARWLASRTGQDGRLDGRGSTRFTNERTPSGHAKTLDHHRALEALVLSAGLTGDRVLWEAAARLLPHAAATVRALAAGREDADAERRYAFVFVCQAGDLEPGALLLAASLKRHLRCAHELIAAVPVPAEAWGRLSPAATGILGDLGVRTVEIVNPVGAGSSRANRIPCLAVPTGADCVVFLDSDILCLRDFADQPRLRAPLSLKFADLQARDECGAPYYDDGVIFVERPLGARLAHTWGECSRSLADDPRGASPSLLESEQIGLAAALAKLGLLPESLDTGHSHPVHLIRIDPRRPPLFARYRDPEQIRQEPILGQQVRSLSREHPALGKFLDALPEWRPLLRPAPAVAAPRRPAPELVITGISRSGTSYLCNLLHRYGNCVVINEPPDVHEPLGSQEVPWGLGTFYRRLRADIAAGRPVRNKLHLGRVTEDTAVNQEVHEYLPAVESGDFILGTKNTIAYLHHLHRIRRALPDARLVVCVRNPLDTIASWKTSFPHLRAVDFSVRVQGRPDDPWLPLHQQAELRDIDALADLPTRRARYWNFLAQRALDAAGSALIVRYEELVTDPLAVLGRVLAGWDPGELREPIARSPVRGHRSALEPADLRAIRALCAQGAADLGLELD